MGFTLHCSSCNGEHWLDCDNDIDDAVLNGCPSCASTDELHLECGQCGDRVDNALDGFDINGDPYQCVECGHAMADDEPDGSDDGSDEASAADGSEYGSDEASAADGSEYGSDAASDASEADEEADAFDEGVDTGYKAGYAAGYDRGQDELLAKIGPTLDACTAEGITVYDLLAQRDDLRRRLATAESRLYSSEHGRGFRPVDDTARSAPNAYYTAIVPYRGQPPAKRSRASWPPEVD